MAPDTAASADQRRVLLSAGSKRHGIARVATGLRTAAADAGVCLSHSYCRRIAADGLDRCGQLGVTQLGEGVVIHTAPEAGHELPVVLGYADADGEWFRDGSRHHIHSGVSH